MALRKKVVREKVDLGRKELLRLKRAFKKGIYTHVVFFSLRDTLFPCYYDYVASDSDQHNYPIRIKRLSMLVLTCLIALADAKGVYVIIQCNQRTYDSAMQVFPALKKALANRVGDSLSLVTIQHLTTICYGTILFIGGEGDDWSRMCETKDSPFQMASISFSSISDLNKIEKQFAFLASFFEYGFLEDYLYNPWFLADLLPNPKAVAFTRGRAMSTCPCNKSLKNPHSAVFCTLGRFGIGYMKQAKKAINRYYKGPSYFKKFLATASCGISSSYDCKEL